MQGKLHLAKWLVVLIGSLVSFGLQAEAILTESDALAALAQVDASGNFSDQISVDALSVLPLGVKRSIGSFKGTIAVSNAIFYNDYIELTVFARLEMPFKTPKQIHFGAQRIKLSYDGSLLGNATLLLLKDIHIPVCSGNAELILRGGFNAETGRGEELTFVNIVCNGFKEVGLAADVEFPGSMFTPVNERGELNPNERVRGSFRTVIESWTDILGTLSLPSFEIRGLDGFIFNLREVVMDFSEKRNASSVVYPFNYDYTAAGVYDGRLETWQGFFARELSITLPKQFSTNENKRVSMEAVNMLIDATGVSGVFAANNVLSFDNGSAGSWAFSVDRIEMVLQSNTLTKAAFDGKIGLPLASQNRLGYLGMIDADNNYLLKVETMGTMTFDVFMAKAELHKNSYIQMAVKDGVFLPEAMLHGRIGIFAANLSDTTKRDPSADSADNKVNFQGIEFRSLRLQTVAPYLNVEYFGYNGELKLFNFPLSGENISLTCMNDQVALNFGLRLTLSDGLFSGATGLRISGALEQSGKGRMLWKYKKTDITDIDLHVEIAESFKLDGFLRIMNDDPVYGNGFAGSIDMTIKKGLEITAGVRTIFGCSDFRYWLVDANVQFAGGIYMPPCFRINGFGGGAYFRMQPDLNGVSNLPTGLRYIPDRETGLGLRAAVMFAIADEKVAQAEASFEMAFNAHGGLNFIGFYGKFEVMAIPGLSDLEVLSDKLKTYTANERKFTSGDPKKKEALDKLKSEDPNAAASQMEQGDTNNQPASSPAVIYGNLGMRYDFRANSLHANANVYLYAANGLLHGTGTNNRAGWAELHIDPEDWYLYMGVPDDPVGVTISLGNIVNISTASYFMVGTKVLDSPPPPKEVADILGVQMKDIDYMSSLNAIGAGKGFAFGSRLNVSTGEMTFLLFYASFHAGFGFDIMLKDYGDAQCRGYSGPIGMNGWFANGQTYAYLQGEMGIKVKLWFINARVPILSAGAAALMQAKLPNPSWFRGYLGVRYNVLGGLIKGNCNFKMTLGNECEILAPGSSPVEMEMIADMSPDRGSQQVDVFLSPQATFNMPVGKVFEVTGEDGARKKYRIKLNEFSVKDEHGELTAAMKWNSDYNAVNYITQEVLPSRKTLTATVRVGFEEYINGQWHITKTGGVEAQEIKQITFTTGDAPDYIPMQNILYTYPVVDQNYFLKEEYPEGFIQLEKGQSYLFADNFAYEARLISENGNETESLFSYNESEKRLNYTLPFVENATRYRLELVARSLRSLVPADQRNRVTEITEEDYSVIITEKQASTVIRDQSEKVLLEYDFATSRFNTLHEKIHEGVQADGLWWWLGGDITHLIRKGTIKEPFDLTEIEGNNFTGGQSLLFTEAATDDAYYQEEIGPLLYVNYPVGGQFHITRRNVKDLGIAPVKAVYVIPKYITDGIATTNNAILGAYFPYYYGLREIYKQDYYDIATQIVNKYMNTEVPEALRTIIWYACPVFKEGMYNIHVYYRLPGDIQTSKVPVWYKYAF